MDDKDGPSPSPEQHTSRSSGGANLSLEDKFSLIMDKMEQQTEQFKQMSAAFQETQWQSAEAKESKYLFYKFFRILFAPYPLYLRICNPESSISLWLSPSRRREQEKAGVYLQF